MSRLMVRTSATLRAVLLTLGANGCVAMGAHADSLSLDLNDDAARLTWRHPIESNKTQIDASILHHQNRGNVLAAGFHITGNAATRERPVNAGLGGRFYYTDADRANADGGALAVGGFVDAKLPSYNRVGFGGHIYYAPDVLGFGDVEEILDITVEANYSVLREGEVYLGWRNVGADFDDRGDVTFDTGFFVGFRLNF